MKALLMDQARALVVADVPEPQPKRDNLIVQVNAASICGTDMRTFLKGSAKINAPRILGHEFAGTITHVGDALQSYGFAVSDRVTAAPAVGCGHCRYCQSGFSNMCDALETLGFQFDGVFAPYAALPAKLVKNGNLLKLPDSVSFDAAALIEPAACAWNAHTYLKVQPGESVLIYGAGLIGCIHAELAFLAGAKTVLLVEPSEKRGQIAMAKVPGVKWLNPSQQNIVDAVRALTDGTGADVVITATSVSSVQKEAQIAAAKRGRICLFGGLPGEGFVDANLIHYKELQVFGSHATTSAYMREIIRLLETGKLDVSKYMEREVGLENIMDGFVSIRDENTMKVVVHPNE